MQEDASVTSGKSPKLQQVANYYTFKRLTQMYMATGLTHLETHLILLCQTLQFVISARKLSAFNWATDMTPFFNSPAKFKREILPWGHFTFTNDHYAPIQVQGLFGLCQTLGSLGQQGSLLELAGGVTALRIVP